MDVVRSAPQGVHYYVDVIYLLPQLEIQLLNSKANKSPNLYPCHKNTEDTSLSAI